MRNTSLYKQLRITGIKLETADVKTFVLESIDGPILYSAGQYLTLVFERNGEEIRRSYSLASSPVLNEPLAITVKRVDNGFASRILFDKAKAGDTLLTTGAGGFFVLPENISNGQQLFFLAAGSGIVPVFSLIKTTLQLYPGVHVVLIYSNRSIKTTIFHDELKVLQQQYPNNFQIEFLFSMSADLTKARLNQILLQVLLQQYSKVPGENIGFYTCGPFPYMRMIEIELLTMGFSASQIRKEQFSTIRPAITLLPPDTAPHEVEIRIQENVYHFTVQYPHTILEAAKKQGIALPYSCEVGRCGSCAALCLQGKVWMKYNEVLLNDETRKGLVLTCSGFPVEGDVVLQF